MFFIAGRRNKTEVLGNTTLVCRQCKRDTLHSLMATGMQATAFFVPLATINKKLFLQCTVCGYGYDLTGLNGESLATNPTQLAAAISERPIIMIGANAASGAAPTVQQQFYVLNPVLYVILSVLTFGLFTLYWAIRNWMFLRAKFNKQYSSFWRAVFFPFYLYSLTDLTYKAAQEKGYTPTVPTAVPMIVYLAAFVGIYFVPESMNTLLFVLYLVAAVSVVPILSAMKFYNEKR